MVRKMQKYRFQDVLCPYCKKSFMTMIYDNYDCSITKENQIYNGWFDRCPKCNGSVIVIENVFEGEKEDSCEYKILSFNLR